jgi:zinc/manganese transport system substrate-binding protein
MRRGRRTLLALLAPIALFAVACGDDGEASSSSSNPDAAVQVVATTTVTADFVAIVGGERVGVYSVAKPNVDLHDYEPSPADLNAMKRAQVIVRNGLGLESWLDDTLTSSGTKAAVIDSSEGVTAREGGHEDEDEHGDEHEDDKATSGAKAADDDHGDEHDEELDPHIWHDPRNAKVMVTNIAKGLSAADPDGAAVYEKNLAAYLAELDALDKEIEAQVAGLTNKKLVTNHDAFGYFVDRYGFEFIGSIIPSFDSSAELSAADLTDLVSAIKAEGVTAVFSEASLPAKTAKTIADEAKVKVVAGESALYGDGLGPASSSGGTYLKMMRHNASTIVSNLR